MTSKVTRYVPRNSGIIHAVQWTGKAECLVGMPEFNEVVTRIISIDNQGLLKMELEEGKREVRPVYDFIVVDAFNRVDVYSHNFLQENYEPVPEKALVRAQS